MIRSAIRKGFLIYDAQDYERNASYIDWLIRTAEEYRLSLSLITLPASDLAIGCSYASIGTEHPLHQVIRSLDDFDHGDEAPEQTPEQALPFLINRTRSALLAQLAEARGYRVFNSSLVAHLGNDKIAGYRWASELGLSVSPLIDSPTDADFPLVQKPVFGHGGRDVRRIENPLELKILDEPFLLQKPVPRVVGDIRFYVIGGQCIYSVLRKGNGSFASNFSLGGSIELFQGNAEQQEQLNIVLRALPIDYAGVDFLLTEDGQLYFNEIEDVVGSRMLSALGCNDTTERFLRHIAATIGNLL
ncbi:MAG: hypothetical protein Q4A52_02060 [Bacillota bacterium]|nr:hypothetical protein [Bacillota bacterium]